MNPQNSKGNDSGKALDRVFDLAYGTDSEIEKMSAEQVRAELRDSGINTDAAWNQLQKTIKIAEGKVRMAAARAKRQQQSAADRILASISETREALIGQIQGLLTLSGEAGVYARKWENSTVEDLKSLRDELARTAARAAEKKKHEKL